MVNSKNNSNNSNSHLIPPEEARLNHDGSEASHLQYGVLKRTIVTNAGRVKNQYIDRDGKVIPDYRKFVQEQKSTKARMAAQQIQNAYAEQEEGNGTQASSTGFKTTDVSDHEPNQNELIDKEIDRAVDTGEMLRLDEAFPDVGVYEEDGRSLPSAPAIRARQAALHGQRYQKEYILRTLHRLTLRRVPTDQIAQMFNVTVPTIYGWVEELRARLKAEATTITITQVAGDTLSFYNEIRSTGLTTASTAETTKERIKGMEVALKAEQDKHRFLQVAGFYDTAKLGRETMEDESAKKAREIVNMTKNLLSGNYEVTEESETEISGHDRVII
tara:strand:- start:793 stop:1782 length:990 start_codon:yes stop_codon:yes gene_type:complete